MRFERWCGQQISCARTEIMLRIGHRQEQLGISLFTWLNPSHLVDGGWGAAACGLVSRARFEAASIGQCEYQ